MKKTLFIFLLALAIGQAENAMAATVQVVPSLVNSHGGTATGADLKVCIVQSGSKTCDVDMPTFSIGEGSYEVQFFPPAGYSYEANYRCPNGTTFDYAFQKEVCRGAPDRTNTCSGTIGADEDKVCYVSYYDGAPIVAPTQPSDSGTTGGVTGNTSAQPEPSVPIVNPTPVIVPTPQVVTAIASAPAPIKEVVVVVHTQSTTTVDNSTTTKQDIQDLQKRVGILEKAVNWIVSFLKSLFGF